MERLKSCILREVGMLARSIQSISDVLNNLNHGDSPNSHSRNAQALFQRRGYIFVGEMNFLGKEKPFYCYEKTIA